MSFAMSVIVKTIVVLISAGVLSFAFRHRSASTRHLIWTVGLWAVLALPVISAMLPQLNFPILPASPVEELVPPSGDIRDLQYAIPDDAFPLPIMAGAERTAAISPDDATTVKPWTWRNWMAIIWAFGSIALMVRFLAGAWQVRVLRYNSVPVTADNWQRLLKDVRKELSVKGPVDLRIASEALAPMTWGVFRHVILLPSIAAQWSGNRLRLVLAHELAHVKRNDGFTQIISRVACSIYWFNPIVWFAVHRIGIYRELACDDHVLNLGARADDYADHLLQIARGINSGVLFAAVPMAHPAQLETRFRAILDPLQRRQGLARIPAGFLLSSMAMLTLATGAVQLTTYAPFVLPALAATSSFPILSAASGPALTSQSAAPASNRSSSVEGVVVRFGTNEPISDVDVELTRIEGTTAFPLAAPTFPPGTFSAGALVSPTAPAPTETGSQRTKDNGRFKFDNLKPGVYQLLAARAGGAYYPAEYGQRDPMGRGLKFPLAEGQVVSDAHLGLTPTGSISGHVTDADGIPAGRVRVIALELSYQSGQRWLSLVQSMNTDERGEYRLFWLPPGRYFIAARPEDLKRQNVSLVIAPPGAGKAERETFTAAPITRRSLGNGDVVEETYELVYYGGGRDPQHAQAIELAPGANISAIDVSLAGGRVTARRIRGVVVDAAGRPSAGALVRAIPRDGGPSIIAPTATADGNGLFEIAGAGPGPYFVRATSTVPPRDQIQQITINTAAGGSPRTEILTTSGAVVPGLTGVATVGEGTAGVENVRVIITPGFSVSGRVIMEGRRESGPEPDAGALRISLAPYNALLPAPPQSLPVNGEFTIMGVQAGNYRLSINPILPAATTSTAPPQAPPSLQSLYVKSIRLGSTDVLNERLHIAGPPDSEIQIVIGANGGSMEGRVIDLQRRPSANATVTLIPDDPLRARPDLYKTVSTDSTGRFRLQGMAPGNYKLFAWDRIENGAWHNPEFMRSHEGRGVSVRIGEGRNPDINLTVIPE